MRLVLTVLLSLCCPALHAQSNFVDQSNANRNVPLYAFDPRGGPDPFNSQQFVARGDCEDVARAIMLTFHSELIAAGFHYSIDWCAADANNVPVTVDLIACPAGHGASFATVGTSPASDPTNACIEVSDMDVTPATYVMLQAPGGLPYPQALNGLSEMVDVMPYNGNADPAEFAAFFAGVLSFTLVLYFFARGIGYLFEAVRNA